MVGLVYVLRRSELFRERMRKSNSLDGWTGGGPLVIRRKIVVLNESRQDLEVPECVIREQLCVK